MKRETTRSGRMKNKNSDSSSIYFKVTSCKSYDICIMTRSKVQSTMVPCFTSSRASMHIYISD